MTTIGIIPTGHIQQYIKHLQTAYTKDNTISAGHYNYRPVRHNRRQICNTRHHTHILQACGVTMVTNSELLDRDL